MTATAPRDDTALHRESTIRQRLQRDIHSFTKSERTLALLLNGESPTLGLSSIHEFAARSGVSAPTIARFAVKLGFGGYTEFQRAWLAELESQLTTPLTLMAGGRPKTDKSFGGVLAASVKRAIDALDTAQVRECIQWLADGNRRIYLRGGRYSQVVARHLYNHLQPVRPDVHLLGEDTRRDLDAAVGFRKRDILIVFDFRRYQNDTIALAAQAAVAGSTVVLFTDRWLSPASNHARVVIISDVAVPSPNDSLVPSLAQAEQIATEVMIEMGERATARMNRLEALRADASGAQSV
ncbi:MAG: RpiR family transcriptional regulator, partial [Rhizobacter sp.]|nr:RpiR family transcriptional regulator [Rhizobacter sp.]